MRRGGLGIVLVLSGARDGAVVDWRRVWWW